MPRPRSVRARRAVSALVLLLTAALTAALAACTSSTNGHGSTGVRSGTPSVRPSDSSSARAGSAPQAPAKFTDCSTLLNLGSLNYPAGRKERLSFGCAKIKVPLDYHDPSGATVEIQLIRVHDRTNTAPTGSLLVNPGGPGASGVETAVGLALQVSNDLLAHFDLVGFDPRGVGLSTPIRCLSDSEKDTVNAASPNVLTASGFAAAKQAAKKIAQACTAKYGKALAQFDTVQTARDMDRIRQAVGDAKMNYLGFSYGTELGSIYAHLYPKNVRVAVLDGAVNPLTDDITSFANQLKGFEDSFDQFAAYCRKNAGCQAIGNPRQAVYEVAAKASKSPIPSSTPGESRKATSSLVYTGVLQALYSQSLWSTLGSSLEAALNGNSAGLLSLADQYNQRTGGHYSNISDANTAIGCNDSKPGPTDAQIRATAKSWKKRFPIFGLWSAASLFGCQQWQPDRNPLPLPTAPTKTKVLVVGNINDPATPYQGAKDLARTMGNARLLTWDGEGHTSYLQGSTCIDDHVNKYLISGTVPPAGTKCPR